jgi:hypothetical protein
MILDERDIALGIEHRARQLRAERHLQMHLGLQGVEDGSAYFYLLAFRAVTDRFKTGQ